MALCFPLSNIGDGCSTLDPLCWPYYISRHAELHVGEIYEAAEKLISSLHKYLVPSRKKCLMIVKVCHNANATPFFKNSVLLLVSV